MSSKRKGKKKNKKKRPLRPIVDNSKNISDDIDKQYEGTELEGLDAFTRQLRRFGISPYDLNKKSIKY